MLASFPSATPRRLEVFVFSSVSIAHTDWQQFNWKNLTTIATFGAALGQYPPYYCIAKEHNVRLVNLVGFAKSELQNTTARAKFVREQVQNAQLLKLDGINLDFESEIGPLEFSDRSALTMLTKELYNAFHASNPYSQVTFDVAWSADNIDQRNYNYFELSQFVDYLFLMVSAEQLHFLLKIHFLGI